MNRILLVLSLLMVLSLPCVAEKSNIYSVEAIGQAVIKNITPEDAERLALKRARRSAIEQAVGVNVFAESVVINHKLSSDVIKTIPYGNIINEKIISKKINHLEDILIMEVKIRAEVIKENHSDKESYLKVTLDKYVLKDGDKFTLNISADRSCYLYVFNIVDDEFLIRLFPLNANDTLITSNNDQKILLKAYLHSDYKSLDETIYSLCTIKPIKFSFNKMKVGYYKDASSVKKSMTIQDLYKSLIDVPLNERSDSFVGYRIFNEEL